MEVSIYEKTCFILEISDDEEVTRKSILVKVIQEPSLIYELTYMDPTSGVSKPLKPAGPLLDSFFVVSGMHVTVNWRAENADSVTLNGLR